MCWPKGLDSPGLKKRRNKHQGSSFPSEYCGEEPGVWQTVPSITPAGERPPRRKLQFPGIPRTVVGPEFLHAPRADATCHTARPIADTKDVWGSGWGMGRRLLACTGDVRGELKGSQWIWGYPQGCKLTPTHCRKGHRTVSSTMILFANFLRYTSSKASQVSNSINFK